MASIHGAGAHSYCDTYFSAYEEYGRHAEHKSYTRYAWISANHAHNNGCDKT